MGWLLCNAQCWLISTVFRTIWLTCTLLWLLCECHRWNGYNWHLHLIKTDGIHVARCGIIFCTALGRSKADPVVSKVKLSVETSNEDIAKNPEGTQRGRNIQSNESTQTDGWATLLHLQTQQHQVLYITYKHNNIKSCTSPTYITTKYSILPADVCLVGIDQTVTSLN